MKQKDKRPYLISLQQKGNPEEGYLSIATAHEEIPFSILRSFINYGTPSDITRGRHAHYQTEMVLLCLQGRITVQLEEKNGEKSEYILRNCQHGLYIPPLCWHVMHYQENSIQLVYCSTVYEEEDYIRDYDTFKVKTSI